MSKAILVSWLGSADMAKLCANNSEDDLGALALTAREAPGAPFAEIWLFHTTEANASRDLAISRLGELLPNTRIVSLPVAKAVIVDPAEIYRIMAEKLGALKAARRDLTYNLTSGTPAMYAAQLLLADGAFPGIPLYTVKDERTGRYMARRATLPSALAGAGVRKSDEYVEQDIFISTANERVYTQAREKVAPLDASVLILGETGVGKSRLAEYIHAHSRRANRKMISVNCAEVAGDHNLMRGELFGHVKGAYTGAYEDRKGKFALAHGSTLFLDEVGEIPMPLQGMLLRALAERQITPLGSNETVDIDVRVIAATNRPLLEDIAKGLFRQDLYYRLAQYSPTLAPIRLWPREDRIALLERLLAKINARLFPARPRVLSPGARDLLLAAPWRGNLREMEFRIQSVCILSGQTIEADDVLSQLGQIQTKPDAATVQAPLPGDLKSHLEKIEKDFLARALAGHRRKKEAAASLGLNVTTFNDKLKKYGLS